MENYIQMNLIKEYMMAYGRSVPFPFTIVADVANWLDVPKNRKKAKKSILTHLAVGVFVLLAKTAYDNRRKLTKDNITQGFAGAALRIPGVQNKIKKIILNEIPKIERSFFGDKFCPPSKLPDEPLDDGDIFALLDKIKGDEKCAAEEGKASGHLYHGGEDVRKLQLQLASVSLGTNPLHPSYVNRIEAAIIRMGVHLFRGDKNCCGAFTEGGTISILLAMLAWRNYAYSQKNKTPSVIIAESAHAAFRKAGKMFNIKIIEVPVDPETYTIDLKAVEKAIKENPSTIGLVGSACSFSHGVIDPIGELGKIAQNHNLLLHVDACLGGGILAFAKGKEIPVCDFRISGVSSISVDLHKYFYCPKGSSLILWRDKELRKYHYSIFMNWGGGHYATPTLMGSRSGSTIVQSWGIMHHFGIKGYEKITEQIIDVRQAIQEGINKINEIEVVGDPKLSVVSVTSKTLSAHQIAQRMKDKYGWEQSFLTNPEAFHIALTYKHVSNKNFAEEYLADLKRSVTYVKDHPEEVPTGTAATYCAAHNMRNIPGVTDEATVAYLDVLYQPCPSYYEEKTESDEET